MDHPLLVANYTNLGVIKGSEANYKEALEYYEKAIKIRKKNN